MLLSLDTETTGIDFAHGAKPFLVTTCSDETGIEYWEWDVNPLTRQPHIPESDLVDISELIENADLIYFQNGKFDAHALRAIGIKFPWDKYRDTLVAAHLLASNHNKDLTSLVEEYLGSEVAIPFEQHELNIKEIVKTCRNLVKKTNPDWRIAKEGEEDMPSIKPSSSRDEDKPWKNDMWLPRAICLNHDDYNEKWLTACSDYANADSEHTLYLGLEMERLVRERGHWEIYLHKLKVMRCAYEMEAIGTTVIGDYTKNTIDSYDCFVSEASADLVSIAQEYGHDLELAKGASLNDNMRDFFYGAKHLRCKRCDYFKRIKHWNDEEINEETLICPKCLKGGKRKQPVTVLMKGSSQPNLNLPVILGKKSGNASLDKESMQEYLDTLDGTALDFIKLLVEKRKHDTDLSYMRAYKRFWVPIVQAKGFYKIHPSLNPCGTDHLRWASNNPNCQNIGKQEDRCDDCEGRGCEYCNGTGKTRVSVRNCFGPAPGREWWSMDFQNIELRIPAYESGEEAMIELFEKPNEPPYFGSYHCLNASIVYPDLFWPLANAEGAFKKAYKSTEYQWCKNGGFALQYGCGEDKADRTFRVKGAYRLLKQKLPKIAALNNYYIKQAEKTGFIKTLPDKTINPESGYPILASRTDDNRILSTTPFNYHVSGTACWCKNTALIRCIEQCERWRKEGFDAYVILEIHDELLFDFPKGKNKEENLPRALILKKLMEESGDNLIPRIPTPVTVEYHEKTWAEGIAC